MRVLCALGAILLLLPGLAKAAGSLDVDSNVRSDVYLDGEPIGSTPAQVRDIPCGNHEMVLVDPATGKRQIFIFYTPKRVTVHKEVRAVFQPGDPADRIIQVGPEAAASRSAHPPAANGHRKHHSGSPHRSAQAREKVRIRNTALGIGTLGVLTGTDALTGIGFGGALVNELVNK